VNFDLVYGLPGQTESSFASTLDRVVELAPDRIALYGFAHVPWVKKQTGRSLVGSRRRRRS
jgi:oxygen-independent coproporphyrinogen-3 oxidase